VKDFTEARIETAQRTRHRGIGALRQRFRCRRASDVSDLEIGRVQTPVAGPLQFGERTAGRGEKRGLLGGRDAQAGGEARLHQVTGQAIALGLRTSGHQHDA